MGRDWLTPLAGLVVALALAVVIALVALRMPAADTAALARFLLISSVPSLVLGYGIFHAVRGRLRTLWQQITVAYGLGLVIALVNITITARLMFLSAHDLDLLTLLLAFAGALSLFFGVALAVGTSRGITRLAHGAADLAGGNLAARVRVEAGGEVADLARAFNRMAARVEEAFERERREEAARRDLIAAISHDLRTPLASMRAMIEALADGMVSDRATTERYLSTLRGQIESLSALIDDLFELSHLDRAREVVALEPVSLRDLISDTLEAFRAAAAQKGVGLAGEVDAGIDVIRADPHKIQRVLTNLVDNAIRHTPAGGSVRLAARPNAEGVLVEVADTGEGIAPAEVPRVFDWFYRGEKSRSRAFGGAGLGLAIARSIVEAHGGRIWVDSGRGPGSVFRLVIPDRPL